MGDWMTVSIRGHIDSAEAEAAQAFVFIGRDWDRFHCLCQFDNHGFRGAGLGMWIPAAGGDIKAYGNLSERGYGPHAVAETLEELAKVAPSLTLKVHCGGSYESTDCTATVTLKDGLAVVGDPELADIQDPDPQPPTELPELPQVAVIDGREALAYLIIRPNPAGGVTIESAANGLDHAQAAYCLRAVADKWDPPTP